MDQRLHDRLEAWHAHIQTLSSLEKQYLSLEANEKSLFSALFLASEGRNVTERECKAYTHPDWIAFKQGLVEAQAQFNRGRRELELKQSAFNASYLACKNEQDAIVRFPKAIT